MSSSDEPRIRCPSCGKLAPAMKYCIYCGSKMPQAIPPTVRAPLSVPPSVPPSVPGPERAAPIKPSAGTKDEINSLMSGVNILFDRKIALLDLFQSSKVSEKIFQKLFNEYNGKLNEALNARNNKIKELGSKLSEKNNRLSEVAMKLEELEIRHKIGEIDKNVYSQRTEALRMELQELSNSVKTFKTNIDNMESMLSEKKPSEIRELERNIRTYETGFKKLVAEGKISTETLDIVKPDIEKTLDLLNSLIRDRKEKEEILREQLETLQTRYKLSELSIEEYEKRKRELQAEIDKIWA